MNISIYMSIKLYNKISVLDHHGRKKLTLIQLMLFYWLMEATGGSLYGLAVGYLVLALSIVL